jgi:acid phosphatase (class A)
MNRSRAVLARAAFGIFSLTAPLRAAGPYLHGFDAAALLPPPPALHDAEDMADRDSTFQVYNARTPEEVARGKAERRWTLFAFAPAIGPEFQPGRFPIVEVLFKDVGDETEAVVGRAKDAWGRPRPSVDDPARFSDPGDPIRSPSYPSGHSTRGTVFAILLAEIFPDRRAQILEKGRAIGWVRVEIGVHTPLDIYAGRVLGQALAQAFLRDPRFQKDLAAAKAEVAAYRAKQAG